MHCDHPHAGLESVDRVHSVLVERERTERREIVVTLESDSSEIREPARVRQEAMDLGRVTSLVQLVNQDADARGNVPGFDDLASISAAGAIGSMRGTRL